MENDHYKTIVNYLPQSLTDNEFLKIFERVGPVAEAKIVRNKNSSYSYGFGFVEYLNKSDAEKAISQLNGLQLKNKRIKVAWSRPCNDEIKKAKLYIKNVPDISVEALNQVFGKYGEIIQSNIVSNKNKGIAFILYNKREQAQNAIDNLQGVLLPGSQLPLEIKFAFTNSVKFQNNQNNLKQMRPNNNFNYQNNRQHNNFNTSNNNFNNNNFNNNNINHNIRAPRNYSHYQSNNYYSNNNYEDMDNESASSSNVYRSRIHNSQYGHKTHHTNRYNPMNPSSSSSRSYDDSYKSAEYSEPTRNYHYQNYYSTNYQQHPNQNYNNHRNHQNYQNTPDEQPGYTIFVYNIGMITEEQLVSLFSKFGYVIKCNVFRNKKFAFINMLKYENAANAIQNLNNYVLNGNRIQVSFKK